MPMRVSIRTLFVAACVTVLAAAAAAPTPAQAQTAQTPPELVATYESLADAILAVKASEDRLVRSILGAAHAHAQVELGRARAAIKANDNKGAQAALENLAAVVGQIASEGDASVGAVRKRLIEGGHHHNAEGEAKGVYDEGFVVVTRAAKQSFLEVSRSIGQVARAPKAEALDAAWAKFESTWNALMKPAK
jgi:hypothetical protein